MVGMDATNTSLLRRLCDAGDDSSWSDFVDTYDGLVRSYVAQRSLSRGLRLDDHDLNVVVQSVWIKLWQKFDDFELDRRRGRFRTFLYAVTVNALIDFVRRNRKHFAGRVPWERIELDDMSAKPDEDWNLAYRTAIWQRVAEPMKVETMRENPMKWNCFEKHKVLGQSAKDVAEELGITPDLVYQNVSRIMKQIRQRCLAVSEEELVDER